MNKRDLSEADIEAKFITPALIKAGWDENVQISRQKYFTDGRIYVKGKMTVRGKAKFADYLLFYKPNIPIAVIESKDNNHSVKAGIQQALGYSNILDIPFVFSSNGDAFYFHDKTVTNGQIEKEISLDDFPSPAELWEKYQKHKGLECPKMKDIISSDYFHDGSGRSPRYYQQIAINRTVEAVAKKQNRILLVMATGTGKTYTAFQIIYRLWKSGTKKRILFLADRTALIDQTARGDFRHFKDAMTIIKHKNIDTAYNIYLALYQGLSDSKSKVNEISSDAYKQFSPDFFDLVIIDECHRGSAKEDSKWREILEYFKNATHLGMTATPKETNEVSNIEYFGDPIYTYSLRQGIDDGFLAPYKVLKVTLDIDAEGWRPPTGFLDKDKNPVEDRIYNRTDFDKNIVIDERRELVAKKVTEFLKGNDRYAKTIVFCIDIEHAEGMRQALINENADMVLNNNKYIMQITGDNDEGKKELDNFINPMERYPVIATTSKLMTTGVDAQTCKLIVLDSNIGSMTEFKQIIGRGTRINEEYGKTYFTIMDFRNVTNLFADSSFDGDPVMVKDIAENDDISNVDNLEDNTTIIDPLDGEEIEFSMPEGEADFSGEPKPEYGSKEKIRVDGVVVKIVNERVQYLGSDGKIITETLKDYTKKNVLSQYSTLDSFLTSWNNADIKKAIVDELESQGIFFDALKEEIGKDFDPFDLICHVAYEAKPLTRKERANNVTKRNYFVKYGEQALAVIQSLLDKYADSDIFSIESLEVLKQSPVNQHGAPLEIIKIFGGKEKYLNVLQELKTELYKVA
ncbi:MAG: DEAD/DEAH box helicase family protein [Tannerella sp.]|jgi:type I restriction enzyme R subunit|nr:DEAD/DEAH box helicase family protein [Tannerella sp.]